MGFIGNWTAGVIISFAASGVFADTVQTSGNLLHLQGTLNSRDIGGYRTKDGRQIVRGRLFRSSELSYLTDTDRASLRALNIRTVVDFRSPNEARHAPDRLPAGVNYVNSPIIADKLDIARIHGILEKEGFPDTMLDEKKVDSYGPYYRMLTLVNSYGDPNYVRALGRGYSPFFAQILAMQPDQAILFHCTGGRDRTGVGTALLMYALGVPEKEIEENFIESNSSLQPDRDDPNSTEFEKFRFSSVYLQPEGNRRYQNVAAQLQTTPEKLYDAIKLRPEYIATLFRAIRNQYGSMENFFRDQLGLGPKQIALLRSKFTELPD